MDDLLEIYDELSDIIVILNASDQVSALNARAKHYFAVCQALNILPLPNLTAATATTFYQGGQVNWKIMRRSDRTILIGQQQSVKAEVYLSSLLNTVYPGLHIYWFDCHHRLILCNRAQAIALGKKDSEELKNRSLSELTRLTEPDIKSAELFCEQLIKNNIEVMHSKKPILFEEAAFDAAGRTFLSYKEPFYDQEGKVQGILGISTEITQIKLLQKQLEQSKHATDLYLESILMSSPSNIYWLDEDGRAIGCNDQQAKCVGLNSRHDIIGLTVFDLAKRLGWDPALAQQIREHDLAVMHSGKPSIAREYVVLNGEEKIYLAAKSAMFNDEGKAIGILGISTDITEQVKIEQELQQAKEKAEAANQYKTEFIANISHDIRTPLVGIHGIATWLAEKMPAELQPEMQALINASNQLLRLLNDVIQLAKLEFTGSRKLNPEHFDLSSIINQLVELFTPAARQKNLAFNVVYPAELPRQFFGYGQLIQNTLLNLLSNALKFTDHGHVALYIERDPDPPPFPESAFPLRITIEDTGIGISAQHFSTIFENFHQLNPTYQGKYYGSGLGLAIVQKSVAQLGGKVWLNSEEGKGSRFYVSFALPPSQNPSTATNLLDAHFKNQATALHTQPSLSIEQPEKQIQRWSVLLVEDNALIQKVTVSILNKLRCYVDSATTAQAAVELAAHQSYDLVFMDIGLPDHDGFWTTWQIRQILPSYAATPIIALTAHLDEEYRHMCLAAGMNDILSKPLTIDSARRCLSQYGLNNEQVEVL